MKDTAVLLIDCPDRKGLVARVSSLLYERGANILHADQHQDHELGLFFMRVEWASERLGRQPIRPGAGAAQ
jgi:formyltetrahydrofolate deformylase